jgi:hypothetical protein
MLVIFEKEKNTMTLHPANYVRSNDTDENKRRHIRDEHDTINVILLP